MEKVKTSLTVAQTMTRLSEKQGHGKNWNICSSQMNSGNLWTMRKPDSVLLKLLYKTSREALSDR